MKDGRSRPTAAMIVAVLALAMSMVGTGFAASALTKKQKKQVGTIVNGAFAGRVMAATAPEPGSCQIVSQTGGITGAVATPYCDVSFPRAVANCSVAASPVKNGDFGGQASVRYLGGAAVRVTRTDDAGNNPDTGGFTVVAICPA